MKKRVVILGGFSKPRVRTEAANAYKATTAVDARLHTEIEGILNRRDGSQGGTRTEKTLLTTITRAKRKGQKLNLRDSASLSALCQETEQ